MLQASKIIIFILLTGFAMLTEHTLRKSDKRNKLLMPVQDSTVVYYDKIIQVDGHYLPVKDSIIIKGQITYKLFY